MNLIQKPYRFKIYPTNKQEFLLSKHFKHCRFFPSIKTCVFCGENHDRDVNATKNISKQGINILSSCGMQSDSKQKRGKAMGW